MIDVLEYENGLTCTVFDEPINEYYDLLLDIPEDKHRLKSNYTKDIIHRMDFMCLWAQDDRRIMYGTHRDKLLPRNIARVFSRFYTKPTQRENITYESTYLKTVLSFYNNHPEYYQRLGIDTLFFTREVFGNRKDIMLTRLLHGTNFVRLDTPRYYKNTLQHFYVFGNTNFVTAFPFSLDGP